MSKNKKQTEGDQQWSKDLSDGISESFGAVAKFFTTLVITVGMVLILLIFKWMEMQDFYSMLSVVLGLGCIIYIWTLGRKGESLLALKRIDALKNEIEQLTQQVNTLEKRIINAELVEDFEERLAQREIIESKKLSQQHPDAETPPPFINN